MDPDYVPPEIETRQVYGISMQQRRNDAVIDASMFKNIVTKNKEVSVKITCKLAHTQTSSCPSPL